LGIRITATISPNIFKLVNTDDKESVLPGDIEYTFNDSDGFHAING
jgi:hypothetical protein